MKTLTKYGDPVINYSYYEWRKCSLCGRRVLHPRTEDAVLCCSCRSPRKALKALEVNKSLKTTVSSSERYWHNKIFIAVRKFYIEEMNGSIELWRENLIKREAFFNIVWRTALNSIIPAVEINKYPPPENLRKIYLFTSTASRNREQLVKTGTIENLE